MYGRLKRAAALAVSCAAALTAFTSCGRDLGDLTEPESTEPETARPTIIITMGADTFESLMSNYTGAEAINTVTAPNQPSAAAGTNAVPVTPAAPTSAGQSAAVQPTAGSTESPSPLNYSKEELLTYFNTCANKIKQNKPALTREKQTKVTDIKLSNSLANSLVDFVKGSLLSEDTETKTSAKGQNCDSLVSREGQAFTSALTASDIANISVAAEGTGYKITLAMPEAVNPANNSSYAKIFQFITVDDVVSTYAPKVGATVDRSNISVTYKGCTAELTVDAHGNAASYKTHVACTISMKNASIKKGITINTDVDIVLVSDTAYKNFGW